LTILVANGGKKTHFFSANSHGLRAPTCYDLNLSKPFAPFHRRSSSALTADPCLP
jgi:hypothetical protein